MWTAGGLASPSSTGSARTKRRLRITVELIDASEEAQVWSERYDRVLEDIFDIQDEISQAIVNQLKRKLVGAVASPGATRRTADFEAYASGFFCGGEFAWFEEIGAILRKAYPDRRLPTRQMPNWLLRLVAIFNPGLRQTVEDLGRTQVVSHEKASRILG